MKTDNESQYQQQQYSQQQQYPQQQYAQQQQYPQQQYSQQQQYPQYQPAAQYPINAQTYAPNQAYPANVQYATTPQYAQTAPPINVTVAYSQQPTPVQTGWYSNNRRNKPQSNAVGAASLIFMSGGMNIAWSFKITTKFTYFALTTHMRACWFIGAIIGALIGAFLTNRLKKKIMFLFSSVLVVIGGILFISLPQDADAIIAARYLDGIATGFIFAPTLVMIGEIAVKRMRGMIASSIETMSFALGFYIQLIYDSSWTYSANEDFNIDQMHGLLAIIYGSIALLLAFLLSIESPIFYLVRDQEQAAIDCLRRLQRPYVVTNETYEQLQEHKNYIADNKEMSIAQSAIAGLPALLKMCLYRAMVAMSFSMIINLALTVTAAAAVQTIIWPTILFGTFRWLAALFSSFMMDTVGRKKILLFGIFFCAGMAIGIGIIFDNLTFYDLQSKMTAALCLLFVYQFFAGIYSASSSAYLTEAFPLAIKPYYIAFAFIVQMLVQIIIVASFGSGLDTITDYFYTIGALSIAFFIFGLVCLPETKQTTLLEAQNRFRKFLSTGIN